MAERPNLVLGVVQRLEWEQLYPFVESLQQTSFDGELRLFVSETSRATVRELEKRGVVVVPFRRVHLDLALPGLQHTLQPYMARLRPIHPLYAYATAALSRFARDRRRARAWLAAQITLLTVSRFLRDYVFLLDQGPRYRNVMLSDTRDVFFQGNPFDFEIGDSVHFFLEEPPSTIGSCEFNTAWLRGSYGQSFANELRDRRITCAGITIGSYGAVLEYLRLMADELTRMPRQTSGSDSAAHNLLVHSGRIPNARVVENGAGAVLTMAKMRDVTPEQLVDRHGKPINVVHQYDRHPRITEYLLAKLDGGAGPATTGVGGTLGPFSEDLPEPIA